MADAAVGETTNDAIDWLEAAAAELERAEQAVADDGEAALRAVAEAHDEFLGLIDEYDGRATGSGREAFQAYVDFQDELVKRLERLADDLLAREAFEQAVEVLDKRRLSADDMERAREALEPAAEKAALLADRRAARRRYRRARSAVAARRREVETAIEERDRLLEYADADLDTDPGPLHDAVTAYNQDVREAFREFKRSASARDLLDLLDTAARYPLVGLEPAPDPLVTYLRSHPVGEHPVDRLLEYADYSPSKLAHYVDDPGRFRATVAANRTYLIALDGGALTVDWPPPEAAELQFRARELVAVVDRFASADTVAALHGLRDLARDRDYNRLREAAVAQEHLDAHQRERLRTGAVSRELEGLREERDRLSAALETYPEP